MKVTGYLFGPYWFAKSPKTGKISGLCGVKYNSEEELLADYDAVRPGFGLARYYANGDTTVLRNEFEQKSA